uniref:non-specific serine/threonine protein kinase n=2 Tax=Oryza TaxID=4527 RepID=A0A0E0FAJ7_9ORYZ
MHGGVGDPTTLQPASEAGSWGRVKIGPWRDPEEGAGRRGRCVGGEGSRSSTGGRVLDAGEEGVYIRSAVFSATESGSCAIGWPSRSRATIGTSIRTPSLATEGTAGGRDKVDGGGDQYVENNPTPAVLLNMRSAYHLMPPLAMLLILGLVDHASSTEAPAACLPDQASALLQLKRSFNATIGDYPAAFRSWVAGADCCHWDGVRCGGAGGRVTSLDLSHRDLQASSGLDDALFSLTSLEYLDLSSNDFSKSKLPATGFEKLTGLTHLDLSNTNFAGLVPAGIGLLTSLNYLDLSTTFFVEELDDEYSITYYYSDTMAQLSEPSLETLLANLTNLEELRLGMVMVNMSSNYGTARWCDAMARSSPKLRVISMPYCSLSGPICHSLSALRSLSVIELHYNHLSGPVPEFLAALPSLSVLQLSNNMFEGVFPPIIFQHEKLTTINLTKNLGISGNLPTSFSGDSSLQSLSVSNTNFSGTIPGSISNLRSLKELALGASGFSGVLPSSIGQLKSLSLLEVSGLELVGSIPSWISNLTSLTVLKFFSCGLSGPIPASIGNLKKLTKLALYNCHFSGVIAPQILNLTHLQYLLLHSNNLVGTVELSLYSKMQNLSALNLSNNRLVVMDGENSSSVVSYPSIVLLRLASCSISSFPNILQHLHEITFLDLSYNQIQGAIPLWAWKTLNLGFALFNLSHNKFTSIGSDHPLLPVYIEFFDLSFNNIEGVIPIPKEGSVTLDYSNNRFSSLPLNFSTYLSNTVLFKASNNSISGNIPPSICDRIKSLQLIDLSNNNLTGLIPSCLMEDADALQVLSLKDNHLTGELPDNIKEGCALSALDFSGNSIQGQLPRSLVACRNLEILDIGNNKISDSFPCWMSKLPQLQVLVLKSNKFIGQILDPSYTGGGNNCQFTKLQFADMSSNNLSGTLPEEWFKMLKSMIMDTCDNDMLMREQHLYYRGKMQSYQFTAGISYKGSGLTISKTLRTLVLIDVSNNAFHGRIPRSIGELVLLRALNMSHNALTGPIPVQFANLKQLELLDLSSNELSGEIL